MILGSNSVIKCRIGETDFQQHELYPGHFMLVRRRMDIGIQDKAQFGYIY